MKVKKGLFPWNASGRAIANGRDEGFTKLLFSEDTHAIVGGGIVGTHAGDMIGELALAIEMGADAFDIGKTIHPHPTLGESVGAPPKPPKRLHRPAAGAQALASRRGRPPAPTVVRFAAADRSGAAPPAGRSPLAPIGASGSTINGEVVMPIRRRATS
jgi:hypothetical protein